LLDSLLAAVNSGNEMANASDT